MTKTILSIQSHVAYGYVGNRAAVFPLQRMGFDVIAINTVQFSNHTGYGSWTGDIFAPEHISEILDGIEQRVHNIDALLTGYLGDPRIGDLLINATDRFNIKTWLCDPVMGDVGRGYFVNKNIPDFFKTKAVQHANIITPNQFELNALTGQTIHTISDAQNACAALHNKGIEIVLVTSLEITGQSDSEISMLASQKNGSIYIVTTPKLELSPPPNGSGDMTAALFLGHILSGTNIKDALSKTASSVYGVFQKTAKQGYRELAIIEAQECLIHPPAHFTALPV